MTHLSNQALTCKQAVWAHICQRRCQQMLDVRCLLNRPCLKLSSLHHRCSEAVPEHGSSHRFDRSVQTAGSPRSALVVQIRAANDISSMLLPALMIISCLVNRDWSVISLLVQAQKLEPNKKSRKETFNAAVLPPCPLILIQRVLDNIWRSLYQLLGSLFLCYK